MSLFLSQGLVRLVKHTTRRGLLYLVGSMESSRLSAFWMSASRNRGDDREEMLIIMVVSTLRENVTHTHMLGSGWD